MALFMAFSQNYKGLHTPHKSICCFGIHFWGMVVGFFFGKGVAVTNCNQS